MTDKIWNPTLWEKFKCDGEMRWRRPNQNEIVALMESTHGKHAPVLQQAWKCAETGEVRWLDVPYVD